MNASWVFKAFNMHTSNSSKSIKCKASEMLGEPYRQMYFHWLPPGHTAAVSYRNSCTSFSIFSFIFIAFLNWKMSWAPSNGQKEMLRLRSQMLRGYEMAALDNWAPSCLSLRWESGLSRLPSGQSLQLLLQPEQLWGVGRQHLGRSLGAST